MLTLDYQEEFNFLLLGIFSHYREYQVCHEVNNELGSHLERQDDFKLELEKKGSTGTFILFQYKSENEEELFLIANKGNNGHFIPTHKHIDFFLLVRNHNRYTDLDELLTNIRKSKLVSSVIILDPQKIKAAENFLYVEYIDLELKKEKEEREALKKL